jgi:hypothetical protein
MKRLTALCLILSATLVPALGAIDAPAAQAATACSLTWGSLAKTVAADGPVDTLTGVRAGQHPCYDRLVIDATGARPGSATVQYVTAVTDQAKGDTVPLAGGAFLAIVIHAAATEPLALPSVSGFRTFRQVGYGGSFEAVTTIGLGVRARLPFRAFVLDGPGTGSRLVIDVAHRWS